MNDNIQLSKAECLEALYTFMTGICQRYNHIWKLINHHIWTTFNEDNNNTFKRFDPTLAYLLNPLECVFKLVLPLQVMSDVSSLVLVQAGTPAEASLSSSQISSSPPVPPAGGPAGGTGEHKVCLPDAHERLWQCGSVQKGCCKLKQVSYRWVSGREMDGWVPRPYVPPDWDTCQRASLVSWRLDGASCFSKAIQHLRAWDIQ